MRYICRPAAGRGTTVGVVADMTTPDGALGVNRTAQEHVGDPDILVVNSPGAGPDRGDRCCSWSTT